MPQETLPIIAIVGRPNVGKSTLFNRYAGRRRALVQNTPGITRDRIVEEISAAGRQVLLVDTAGLDRGGEGELANAVQAQARTAIADADAILFVVDGKAGLLPEDEAVAQTLRRTHRPLALAVNKIDTPSHADRVLDFHRLGFDHFRAVSAEHGSGAWDLLEELVAALPKAEPQQSKPAPGIRIAIVGRPNVGKSSLLNRIAGEERAVVSEEPGTTRDAVDTTVIRKGEPYVLVDTAGIRRHARRKDSAERGSVLASVRALERADVALVLVDASEGFTDQDARVANLARERGRPAAIVLNKWDTIDKDQGDDKRVLEETRHGIRFMADSPILTLSAQTGARIARIFPTVKELYESSRREIPTSELNRWLKDTVARHEPAMAQRGTRRRPLKFFYATQAGTQPPTFILFCTEPAAVAPSYRRFLENRMREDFKLVGTPIRLRLRSRRKDSD